MPPDRNALRPSFVRTRSPGKTLRIMAKRATNSESGRRKISSGVPTCLMLPSPITAMCFPQHHGFIEVMGNVDHRDVEFLVDPLQFQLQSFTVLGIKGTQRFVQQQQPWPDGEGAGESHPLLLPAAQLPGLAVQQVSLLSPVRQYHQSPFLMAAPGPLSDPEAEKNVLGDTEVREQGAILIDHADVASFRFERCHIFIANPYFTASLAWCNPAIVSSSSVLPAPLGPTSMK